jgi:predicted dehydrogenase
MEQINIGIVGLGWVAGAHISAFNMIPGRQGDRRLLAP